MSCRPPLTVTVKSGLAYSNANGTRSKWGNSSQYVHRVRWAYIHFHHSGWIGARWLCGNQSYRITIVTSEAEIPEHLTLCPTCEKKATGMKTKILGSMSP